MYSSSIVEWESEAENWQEWQESSARKKGNRLHRDDEDGVEEDGDGGRRSSLKSLRESGSGASSVQVGSTWSHGDDIDAKKSSSATGWRESAGEKSQEEGQEGEGQDGWDEKCKGKDTPSKLSSSSFNTEPKDSQPEIPSSPPGNESGQRESGRRSMTR